MASPETMELLINVLLQQTQAINRLAASNEALVQAMAQDDGDPHDPDFGTLAYLDGKRPEPSPTPPPKQYL